MKNIITLIFAGLLSINISKAQTEEIKIDNLKFPVSPGFNLLDISPTTVERPTSPKLVGINLLNFSGSGNALPKNFAMEFSPYWLIPHDSETVYKFLGLPKEKTKVAIGSGILRKLSVSLCTNFNDSAKNFLPKTNYTSFGARTNLVTFWGEKKADNLREVLKERAKQRKQVIKDLVIANGSADADSVESRLEKARKNANLSVSSIKPLFVLDAAFAYSDAYKDNVIDNRRFNRSAFWLNGTYNYQFGKPENVGNIFITCYYKRMWDNVLIDTANSIFSLNQSNDFGVRAGFEKGGFMISYEYVSRQYDKISFLNSERSVFVLQYKISDNLYAFGTFGKNFNGVNNLLSIFGLNWGFGKTSLPAPKS